MRVLSAKTARRLSPPLSHPACYLWPTMKTHRPRSETLTKACRNSTARRRQLAVARAEDGKAVTLMSPSELAADLFAYSRKFKRPLAA